MMLGRRTLLSGLLAATAGSMLEKLPAWGKAASADRGEDGPPVGPRWPLMSEHIAESADGTPIFYRRSGSGDVTVLFVHGWSCNHRFFGPQFAPVAGGATVLALDLAGHGRSGSRADVSMQGFADDVAAVAAATRGPLIFVVHSTGGRVACAVAKRLDERLLGIVGIDTFQNLGLPLPDETRISERLMAQRADFVGDTKRYVSMFFKPDANPSLVAWVERQMTSTDPNDAIAATEAFARFDAAAAIRGWPKPVLALNADGVPTNFAAIRKVLPGFDLLIMAGYGHFPHLENPEAFNPLLLAMLIRLRQ